MRITFSLVYATIHMLIIQDLMVALDVQGHSDATLSLKLWMNTAEILSCRSSDTILWYV